jgi:hypothetical protein
MRLIAAACCLAILGCASDPKITGVRIIARFDGAAGLTRLAFAWQEGSQPPPFDHAEVRPKNAGQVLASPQDLVVYLDDSLAGHDLSCGVAGDPLPLRAWKTVPLRLHEIVPCEVTLSAGDGGLADAASDGARRESDGPAMVPGDGALPDGSNERAADAGPGQPSPDATPTIDALAPDASTSDTPTISVDAGAPAPDAPAISPDSPVFAPDMNLPPDAPLPPDAAVSNGCAAGSRKAFANAAEFPTVAGCGSAEVSYGQALSSAAAVCAAGWHWCRPAEMRTLPASPAPAQVSGTCGWLDSRQATCAEQQTAYGKADCQGVGTQKSSAGAGTAGACTVVDLTCTSPWKYAVQLQSWATSSLSDPGGCINHVGFSCGGTIASASCWIVCCQD